MSIVMIIGMFLCGIFGVVFSYFYAFSISESFKVGGGAALAIGLVGIALHIVKGNNKSIMNFVSGVLAILTWIFLIIPYAIALPIASIFVPVN